MSTPKGKSHGVWLDADLIISPAFEQLTKTQIRVLLMFLSKRQMKARSKRKRYKTADDYDIVNNGDITFPYSEAAQLGINSMGFTRALDKLIEVGFIDIHVQTRGYNKEPTRYAICDRWKKYGQSDFIRGYRNKPPRTPGGWAAKKRPKTSARSGVSIDVPQKCGSEKGKIIHFNPQKCGSET